MFKQKAIVGVFAAVITSAGSYAVADDAKVMNQRDEAREAVIFQVGPKHWLEDYRFLTDYNPQ